MSPKEVENPGGDPVGGIQVKVLSRTEPNVCVGDDLYRDEAVRAEVADNVRWLDGLLRSRGITRCVVALDRPMPLTDYDECSLYVSQEEVERRGLTTKDGSVVQKHGVPYGMSVKTPGFLQEVRDKLAAMHGEDTAEAARRDFGMFLGKYVVGADPWGSETVVNFRGPVKASKFAHMVHAVEAWVHKPETGVPHALSMGLYGLTEHEATHIGGDNQAFYDAVGVENVAAAFTRHRGTVGAIGSLFSLLGRKWGFESREDIDRYYPEGGKGLSREEWTDYATTPFSLPADVIMYPHPEEYGCTHQSDPQFLTPSIRAKKMIRAYFELITGQSYPVKASLAVNMQDNI